MVCYPSVDAFTGLTLWSVAPKLTLNDLGSRHLKIGTKKAHPVFSTAARLHWQQYSKALEVSKPQSLNTWETTLLWESFLEAETCLNPSQWKVKGEKVAMKKLQKVWKVYKMTILAKPYWLWIRRSFHYHIQLYKRTQTEQSHRHIVQTLDAKKHTVRILSQSPWHAKHSMSSGWPVHQAHPRPPPQVACVPWLVEGTIPSWLNIFRFSAAQLSRRPQKCQMESLT